MLLCFGLFFLFTETTSLPFPLVALSRSRSGTVLLNTWFNAKQSNFMALFLASNFYLPVFPGSNVGLLDYV